MIIGNYKNGNYWVTILDDGTKIRANNLDYFSPEMPESMDIKICNKCDMGCPMCHENSTPDGEIGDIMNLKFIDGLHEYTELAIGGGNPLEHPDLVPFLQKCKRLKLIPSMTVNQVHFMKNQSLIRSLVDNHLIYGLGISLTDADDDFVSAVKKIPNAVIHVINGIVTLEQLEKLKAAGNLKILMLGYKEFRRGVSLYNSRKNEIEHLKSILHDALPEIVNNGWFEAVSFDNLAVQQLEPKRLMSDNQWREFYLGDDGFATMYIDAVKGEFARSSTSTERYPIKDNIKEMFDVVRV